jgi:hypothetical protein
MLTTVDAEGKRVISDSTEELVIRTILDTLKKSLLRPQPAAIREEIGRGQEISRCFPKIQGVRARCLVPPVPLRVGLVNGNVYSYLD